MEYIGLKPLTLNAPINPTLVVDGAGLEKVKHFLDNCGGIFGWDKESNFTKDYYWRKTRTIQVGNKDQQFVIDLLAFCDGDSDILYNIQGEYGKHLTYHLKPVIETLRPYTCSDKFLKVGVNLGFEYELDYWGFGERPYGFYSCDLAERIIVAGSHSLKDYPYFSMEQMFARYFGFQINKELQESFNLTDPLTQAQVEYAALDTRLPLAIRLTQLRILERDDLYTTVKIENDAIPAFVEMHVHGQKINIEKWKERTAKQEELLRKSIDKLDEFFLPIVGSKNVKITDEEIEKLTNDWKALNGVSEREIELKKLIRKNPSQELVAEKITLEESRKNKKEELKTICNDKKKLRTKLNKLLPMCEGKALINYSSQKQLFDILKEMKGFKKLEDTNDESLEKFKDKPIIAALRDFRGYNKQIGTYGLTWVSRWVNGPCKDEGWLHPADGRLHCRFNQLDAVTGRTTSEAPNGQNIPQDPELRACFEADDEDHVIVTADMSGAELRIIAEFSGAKVWVDAFNRNEDVHSVSTEILYPEKWPSLALPGCAYYKLRPDGTAYHEKCKCPEHKKLRDETKTTNFLLAYGGVAFTLAARLGVSVSRASELLANHQAAFGEIWEYLTQSGQNAKIRKESRTLFGRRRLFPTPTWDGAKFKAKEDREEKLRFPKEIIDVRLANFIAEHNRKPQGKISEIDSEMYLLTHSEPSDNQIANAYASMHGSIEREGKNHPIQGTNADIIKIACGSGFDKNGKPFLFHTLKQYGARIQAMIHDELLIHCPKIYGEEVAALVGDAFKRAAAERMSKVEMLFEYHVESCWFKG